MVVYNDGSPSLRRAGYDYTKIFALLAPLHRIGHIRERRVPSLIHEKRCLTGGGTLPPLPRFPSIHPRSKLTLCATLQISTPNNSPNKLLAMPLTPLARPFSQSGGSVGIALGCFTHTSTHVPDVPLLLLCSIKSLHASLARCSLHAVVPSFLTVHPFTLCLHALCTHSTENFLHEID